MQRPKRSELQVTWSAIKLGTAIMVGAAIILALIDYFTGDTNYLWLSNLVANPVAFAVGGAYAGRSHFRAWAYVTTILLVVALLIEISLQQSLLWPPLALYLVISVIAGAISGQIRRIIT